MNESIVETTNEQRAIEIETDERRDVAAPLGTITEGRLVFGRGLSRATIRTEKEMPGLFRAHFDGPVPTVNVEDGQVAIDYRRFSPTDWVRFALPFGEHGADVTINGAIPWQIAIREGATKLVADLGGLRLTGFEINGGASDLEVTLPAPAGVVTIRIDGGISTGTFRRPNGVPVQLSIRGGVSRLQLDDQRFGAIGGEARLRSTDADATDRYEIVIGGGASTLTIV